MNQETIIFCYTEKVDNQGFNLDSFLQKYKFPLIFSLFGLTLIGIGVLTVRTLFFEEPTLEITSDAEQISPAKIVVDLSGAVIKPDVYELVSGSRINDLLVMAGGLAAGADRDWVAKNINLAQKLADGAKIYIPKVGELSSLNPANSSIPLNLSKINLNTATIPELDTLWGIGEATAKKIISGRPFQKPEDLLYKKIVKSNVWEAIKDLVTVY